MFNVGGGEVLVILLVALLVIGPTKLPGVARQIGSVLTRLREVSSGFQNELRSAMEADADQPEARPGGSSGHEGEAPVPPADGPTDD